MSRAIAHQSATSAGDARVGEGGWDCAEDAPRRVSFCLMCHSLVRVKSLVSPETVTVDTDQACLARRNNQAMNTPRISGRHMGVALLDSQLQVLPSQLLLRHAVHHTGARVAGQRLAKQHLVASGGATHQLQLVHL